MTTKVNKLKIFENGLFQGEVKRGEVFKQVGEGKITDDFFNNQSFDKILAYVNQFKQIEAGDAFNPINLNIRIEATVDRTTN